MARWSIGCVAVLSVLSACSSHRSEQADVDAGARLPSSASASSDDVHAVALARVRGVARTHRVLAYAFEHGDGLVAREGRLSSPGDRAEDHEHLAARFPTRADAAFEVDVARVARLRVALAPIGARPVQAKLLDGRAIYADAWASTDLVALGNAFYAEQLLVLRDAAAKPSVSYRMELGSGLHPRWEDETHALVLADANGEARLRVLAPYAVDAKGQVRDAKMTLERDVLRIELDPTGLAYPIVLDPAIESALWVKRAPTASPAARYGTAMAYDSDRKVNVLYGGASNLPSGTYTATADTWEYDGTTWTQRCGAPLAACALPAIGRHVMQYDTALKKTWLHGQWWQGSSLSSWVGQWNGTTWATVSNAYPAPTGTPNARANAGSAYDSTRGLVLEMGGVLGFGPVGDTWTWNGAWAQAHAGGTCGAINPDCRYGQMMAYHAATDQLLMFGGLDSTNNPNALTWVWSNASSNWNLLMPGSSPSARAYGGLVYDSLRKRSVLFGGSSSGTYLDDTYEWNGTTWTPITPLTKPSARTQFAMAFDSGRGRVVLFGGLTGSDATATLVNETWEYHSRGAACTTAAECDTGACVDGVCCESATCGTCQRCDGTSPGTCTAVISADDDTCKAPTATCDGLGVCKKLQGQACAAGTDCLNGICVDGVCCGTACNGLCNACKASLKADGKNDGTCGPALAGLNPHGDCTSGVGGTCGQTGVCDGFGRCALKVAGTSCGTGSVCFGTIAKGQQCDGAGTCASTATGTDCAPGKCVNGCTSTCASDSDCDSTGYCDLAAHLCKVKKANGTTCGGPSECQNPFCVDGVCCNKPCNGQCEACTAKDAVGTCVPINGPPVGARSPCASEPVGSCQQTTCNGVDGSKCAGFVGAEVTCQAGSCVGGKALVEVHCDGKGNCPADAPKICDPYACGDKACKSSCTTNADCVSPASCDAASGKCVNAAKCDGQHTLTSADGTSTTDCSPYNCDVSGACKPSCASSGDCVAPNLCSQGACVPPPEAPTTSSGGCASSGAPGGASPIGVGASCAFAALAVVVRRRRRARRLES